MKARIKSSLLYGIVILCFLMTFLLFYNLGGDSIRSWDEALYGVNALEMLRTGEMIVNTYGYEPDFFNLKPILWPQLLSLSFSLFGENPMGLRFFSPVCMLLTAVLCAVYSYRRFGQKSVLFTVMCFAANRHLLLYHCARSGDADSLYILFSTMAFLALAETESNRKRLYISAACFSLAFLTKSFHAGVIAAVIVVYLFTSREYKKYTLYDLLISLLLAAAPILVWVILRYKGDGLFFIQKMFGYDLSGSIGTELEGHGGSILFYVKNEICRSPAAIACILVTGFVIFHAPKAFFLNKRRYALFVSAVLPFLMFSIVTTKLIHYVYLCYPPFIVLAADCFQELADHFEDRLSRALAVVSVVLCLATTALNVKTVYSLQPQDKVLIALKEIVEKDSSFNEETIYQHYVDPETEMMHEEWRPNAFLTLEMYSALRPKDGNASEWYKDKSALLFTDKSQLGTLKGFRIRDQFGDYLVLEHDLTDKTVETP